MLTGVLLAGQVKTALQPYARHLAGRAAASGFARTAAVTRP